MHHTDDKLVVGTSTRQIMLLLVGKALLLGLVGAMVGCAAGFAMGLRSATVMATETRIELTASDLFMPELFVVVVVATTLLTALASWIPAVMAAAQDPAYVLSEE